MIKLKRLKREANEYKKEHGVPHHQALEEVAKLNGFPNYRTAKRELDILEGVKK